jgi:hypothetical protein
MQSMLDLSRGLSPNLSSRGATSLRHSQHEEARATVGSARRMALALVAGYSVAGAAPAVAQGDRLTIELNKFEDSETGACRAFFLFRNQTDLTLEGFEMSLAIIDSAGVIDRLLSIDAAPLPAARTTLKLFEIPETPCDRIGEILLHELPSCRPQNEDEIDCFPFLDLASRTRAALVK